MAFPPPRFIKSLTVSKCALAKFTFRESYHNTNFCNFVEFRLHELPVVDARKPISKEMALVNEYYRFHHEVCVGQRSRLLLSFLAE